jgi:hypothetical protein
MVRRIAAVLVGILVFVACVSMMDMLSLVFHPIPAGMDQNDPLAMSAHIEAAPLSAMVTVVLGWLVGTFLGSLVICLIDKQRPMIGVAILAALAEAGVLMNAMMLPHPLWMTASGIVLIPLAAYISPGVIFSRRDSRR